MGVDKLITKYPEYLNKLISKYSRVIDNYKFNLLNSLFDNDYDYILKVWRINMLKISMI